MENHLQISHFYLFITFMNASMNVISISSGCRWNIHIIIIIVFLTCIELWMCIEAEDNYLIT